MGQRPRDRGKSLRKRYRNQEKETGDRGERDTIGGEDGGKDSEERDTFREPWDRDPEGG